jgi:alanyl-tRNA synthetase
MQDAPIYWKDPEKSSFQVQVTQCKEENGHYEVYINRPVVRAEGGGQAGDRGVLRTDDTVIEFTDTLNRHGKTVLLCSHPVEEGRNLVLEVDMRWRTGMMRNHSAEHLFVRMMKSIRQDVRLGYIWIDGERGIVDVHADSLSMSEILRGESMVNDSIDQEIPMKWSLVPTDELTDEIRARDGVAAKHEQVRVVSFERLDSSACSGIHVANTSDIGFFKIADFRRIDDGVRVEFLTDAPARNAATKVYNVALAKKHEHSFEMEQLGAIVDKSRALEDQLNLLLDAAEKLLLEAVPWEEVGNTKFYTRYLSGFDIGRLRRLVKRIPFEGKGMVLFFVPSQKPSLILITNELDTDAEDLIADIVEDLGGKGGGSKDVYIGGFSEVEEPRDLYVKIAGRVRNGLEGL